MCFLKDDMGTDDVTNMQLLICAKYPHTPYIALPWFTSIKKQGCCARYWRRSCFHAWLDAWLIFQMVASDSSSRIKIGNFPLAVKCLKPCPWVTHGTTHKCLMPWDYMWKPPHGKSSRPVAWLCMTKFDRELWEKRSGWRLLDEKWRLALGRLWHAWCWHFAPDIIQGSCAKRARKRAKTGAKRRETGAKKKSAPLDPLVLTVMTCRVFLKTLFTHGPNRRHGPKRRRRHVVLSLWGACCFSLSLASSSIAPFSSWNGFISVLLGLPVRMFLDFAACSVHLIYVMYLFVVTVVFLCWMLNVDRPAWGFFVWKKSPTADVVLWELRYSWRLFAGGILAILGLWKTYVMLRWIL